MFAAINVDVAGEDTREGSETAEAAAARVTQTYERALHALRDGQREEAQGALSGGGACALPVFGWRALTTPRWLRRAALRAHTRVAALLEAALSDPFLAAVGVAGAGGSAPASALALKYAALKNYGAVLDAAGDAAAPRALEAYAAAAALDATDVVLWCAAASDAAARVSSSVCARFPRALPTRCADGPRVCPTA
jgi:hypothetical protein